MLPVIDPRQIAVMMKVARSSERGIANGRGPFAAAVVKDGVVIALGNNGVTKLLDPTAHAEVVAIRKACRKLKTFNLKGCDLYTSCEPCPMCTGAILWSRVDRVFYGNTRSDAKEIGFDDEPFFTQVALPPDQRVVPFIQLLREETIHAFGLWADTPGKTEY